MPVLVYSVIFGNVLQGVSFSFDGTLRVTYTGTLLGLFNPFTPLCVMISVSILLRYGAAYVGCKTDRQINARAFKAASGTGRVVG